jgi:hypothetical protein
MNVEARITDVWGADGAEAGWSFEVTLTALELADLLERFDPKSSLSPGISDARPVLRAILNAAIAEGSA